jgi:hypothetical protein
VRCAPIVFFASLHPAALLIQVPGSLAGDGDCGSHCAAVLLGECKHWLSRACCSQALYAISQINVWTPEDVDVEDVPCMDLHGYGCSRWWIVRGLAGLVAGAGGGGGPA